MEYIRHNLKSLLVILILLIGLVVGLYLVQTKHIFKSKAFTDVNEAVEVIDVTLNL